MVIRVKIHKNSTSSSPKARSSSSKRPDSRMKLDHEPSGGRLRDHGPFVMDEGANPRKVPHDDALPVDSRVSTLETARREKSPHRSSSRKLYSRSDARNHHQGHRSRSKSVDRKRDEARNPKGYKPRSSTAHMIHGPRRSKSPSRRFEAPEARRPPAKKTKYVPLNLKFLEINSSSSRSTAAADSKKAPQHSGSSPPLPSEETSIRNNNNNNNSVSTCSDDDGLSTSSSPGRDGAPPLFSSSGIAVVDTREPTANVETERSSMRALASRPASPTISKYAKYSERKAIHKHKRIISKHQHLKDYQRKGNSSMKPRALLGRSMSPATRNRRGRHADDHDGTSELWSKSERATTTLGLGGGSSNYDDHSSHQELLRSSPAGNVQEAKSERGTIRSWGFSSLRSKLLGKDAKSYITEEKYINRPVTNNDETFINSRDDETRDVCDTEAGSHDDDFDNDFDRSGKQIQFLSNVVNKFGSFDSNDHYEETGDDQKFGEIIRTTERLERKLEDVGEPTKQSMTNHEVGELISALSKMHAHAAHLKQNSPALSCRLGEGHVVELTEGPDDNTNWLDTLSKAMFGHCEWK